MKNTFKIILALVLVMTVMAFMFACGDKGAETQESSSESVSDSGTDSDTTANTDDSSNTVDSDTVDSDTVDSDSISDSDSANTGDTDSDSGEDTGSSTTEKPTINPSDKLPGSYDEDAGYDDGWSANG